MERYITYVECVQKKKHQGVDDSAAYEISVLEILFWKYLEYVPLISHN